MAATINLIAQIGDTPDSLVLDKRDGNVLPWLLPLTFEQRSTSASCILAVSASYPAHRCWWLSGCQGAARGPRVMGSSDSPLPWQLVN